MVKLYAFGDPYLVDEDGSHLDGLIRQTKRFAVLIYLLCADQTHPHRSDELVAFFWPEADGKRGRNALRQTLFVIRDQLGPDIIIRNGSEEIRLNPHRIGSDVGLFRREFRKGALEPALALHKAPFLSGFFLDGCAEFEFWMEHVREELQEMAAKAVRNLAHISEGDRDLEASLHWWRVALAMRPYDEEIARRIMALLASSGNRGEAISAFRRFRERMAGELGLEPSAKTLRLAEDITDGRFDRGSQWIGDRRARGPGADSTADGVRKPHFRRSSDGSVF